MNKTPSFDGGATLAWAAGGVGAMCIIGALVIYMQRTFQPPPVGAARAEERLKIWTELKAQNAEALDSYGVIKADNGTYRLPVSQAVKLWAGLNQDGGAGARAKLIERLDKSLKAASYE
jgi:hypothetical protein